jgi:hypothetical protein
MSEAKPRTAKARLKPFEEIDSALFCCPKFKERIRVPTRQTTTYEVIVGQTTMGHCTDCGKRIPRCLRIVAGKNKTMAIIPEMWNIDEGLEA